MNQHCGEHDERDDVVDGRGDVEVENWECG